MLSDTGAVPICFPVALAHCDLARPRSFAVLLAPGPGELGQVKIIVTSSECTHRVTSAVRVLIGFTQCSRAHAVNSPLPAAPNIPGATHGDTGPPIWEGEDRRGATIRVQQAVRNCAESGVTGRTGKARERQKGHHPVTGRGVRERKGGSEPKLRNSGKNKRETFRILSRSPASR